MKQIILNEGQFRTFLNMQIAPVSRDAKRYPVNLEKVKIIKKFLDGGYRRAQSEDLGASGYPEIVPCFGQMDSAGNILRNMSQEDMLDLLMDKYQNLCAEEEETERLIKRVLEDWYNNKITPYGGLSVNYV